LDLRCDVDQLAIREVFRNILENALAAADTVSEIDVQYTRVQLRGKPAIRITIGNDGPRLDAEQQARIFDAFYTTSSQGTGLGMAIAKRLVEEHGGEIAIGACAEQKTELIVTLPTRRA
jgi:signal transduction histidine kinase